MLGCNQRNICNKLISPFSTCFIYNKCYQPIYSQLEFKFPYTLYYKIRKYKGNVFHPLGIVESSILTLLCIQIIYFMCFCSVHIDFLF